MTDILPPAGWPNVRQLETNEFATGGSNGNMNEQAKSLAARSELLKQYAALPYESKTGGYALNERVQLTNGDIVKSTVDVNVNDPNVDMTGWELPQTRGIFDESGLSQQEINDKGIKDYNSDITYTDGSLSIKDGLLQKLTGGVWRPKDPTYYDFGAKIDGVTDDTAAFIAYHTVFKSAKLPKGRMVLSSIDLDQFMNGQSLGLSIEGEGTEQSFFDFTGVNGFYSGTNKFFRDFKLKNLQLNKVSADKTGIGLYVGTGGSEQLVLESVSYRGWHIGRATHSWNSSMKDEVFRSCKYPFSHYGTSTNISNPYAHSCTSPYMLGYQTTSAGVLSVPSIPYGYSTLSGFAADNCGDDGSVYKFGNVAGLTLETQGTERAQGTHIFDFSEITASSTTNLIINNFVMYVPTANNPNLLGICKKPSTAFSQVVFNNLKISTDKQIYLVSGDGSGVSFVNPQMNERAFSAITENACAGVRINEFSFGADSRKTGELGATLGSNAVNYIRIKNRKGKVLIDPNTQKLSIYSGSLSSGLTQGLMTVANITVSPLNKGGNNTDEKAGQILISSAMDYNASSMTGHLKTTLLGTLTPATTVSRNTDNTAVLQFDVVIEASHSGTRMLLDIDLTYNGVSNVNGVSWAVVPK